MTFTLRDATFCSSTVASSFKPVGGYREQEGQGPHVGRHEDQGTAGPLRGPGHRQVSDLGDMLLWVITSFFLLLVHGE